MRDFRDDPISLPLKNRYSNIPCANVFEVMADALPPPRLLPSGDSAITVEFSRTISDAANQLVLAMDRALTAAPIAGISETVPTYRSLLVHYDPCIIDY